MTVNPWFAAIVVCLVATFTTTEALAAPRVSMTIGTAGGQSVATQQWYRLLTDAGVDQLRIRSRRAGEEPAIEEPRSANDSYTVTGVLDERNQLHLPGGRFTLRDAGRLKSWLAKLRADGTSGVTAGRDTPFGLSADQWKQVRADLATPLGFSTQGITPGRVIEQAAAKLKYPVSVDRAADALLSGGVPVEQELQALSRGTSIAYLLRRHGLSLVPDRTGDGSPEYRLRRAGRDQPAWPIGHKPSQSPFKVAPRLYEVVTVQLEDIPVTQLLDAISQRAELPVLLDHHAFSRHDVDLNSTRVNLPEKRTSYSVALRLALGQVRLKSELRQDDAGTPFLWVTTFKPAD